MPPQVSGFRSQVSPLKWREGAVLVATAWLVPFLIHLLPWAGSRPLGVYLLPVYWTTFVALYFRGALPGLAIGLVAPLINLVVTGLPALESVGMMSLEIAFFVAVAALLVRRWPGFWFAAPLAWVAAKAGSVAAEILLSPHAGEPWAHLLRSSQNGLAGLGVLTLINWLLAVFYPRGDAWERE
jgi:hypothetical protein